MRGPQRDQTAPPTLPIVEENPDSEGTLPAEDEPDDDDDGSSSDDEGGGGGPPPKKRPDRKDDPPDDPDDSDPEVPESYDLLNARRKVSEAKRRLKEVKSECQNKLRVKEADAIKVPAFPAPARYPAWKAAVRNEITAASGRGEEAFLWAMRTEAPDVTFDDLRDSEGLNSLDAKLSAALTKISSGELGRRIHLAVEQEALQGRMLKGRQVLWMIHDYHKLDEERGALYAFRDLQAVRLKDDRHLEGFLTTWESVLAGMRNPPPADIVEQLFLDQLRHSKALEVELNHYDRLDRGHADRSYEFLMNSLQKYLSRQRLQRNRTAMTHAIGGGGSHALAAEKSTGTKGKKESKRESSVSAPAKGRGKGPNPPRPPGQGGVCYQFAKSGKCTRPGCPYEHRRQSRSSSRSSNSSRGSSPKRGKGKGREIPVLVTETRQVRWEP
jgi:hypothetical protein